MAMYENHVERIYCPVCSTMDDDHDLVWRIPFRKIDPIVVGPGTVSDFPMCQADDSTDWWQCRDCDSVYLKYVPEDQSHGGNELDKGAKHYIEKMKQSRHWSGYFGRWEWMRDLVPAAATKIVDAAGAIGQYLSVSKPDRPWDRQVLIDYCPAYVEYARDNGYEAFHMDIADQRVRFDTIVGNDFDFIVFSEAFEHMRSADHAMRNLASMLRIGGRVFFSAQALGEGLPVRPAETIYIDDAGLLAVTEGNGLEVIRQDIKSGRFWCIAEKRSEVS